jgi:hypothetical protein
MLVALAGAGKTAALQDVHERTMAPLSVLNRYQPIQQGRPGGSQVNRQVTGVYYVALQISECSPQCNLGNKLDRLTKAFCNYVAAKSAAALRTGTTAKLGLPDNCIDYIFTDSPFGENIYYADLNFLVESWHRVITNAGPEAIVDKFKKKGLPEYQHLMQCCFEEYYRVLKRGRWMTVVFHNSRNAVWNAIQEAMQTAGFVVADVRTLDKQQGSYRQVTVREVLQLQLFVTDESSAIQWLKQQLLKKPQTFQELHPQFLREIGDWQKHEKPLELSELLEQNFLRYDGKGEVPSQIHSYLSTNFKELRNLPKDDESMRAKGKDRWYVPDPNKAGDLEKLCERSLLKEFED